MGSILVRRLDPKTIERLKQPAGLNGRSLQQEVKELLERAAEMLTMPEARRVGAVEASARPAGVLGQCAIDSRGSRFTLSGATSTSMT